MMTAACRDTTREPVRSLKLWLAPMDTSHLTEHAGTAGALFASVFVVATTTMRTMIPLRIFGILTNIDMVDAALCALTAQHLLNRTFKTYGDAAEGFIVVPKT